METDAKNGRSAQRISSSKLFGCANGEDVERVGRGWGKGGRGWGGGWIARVDGSSEVGGGANGSLEVGRSGRN